MICHMDLAALCFRHSMHVKRCYPWLRNQSVECDFVTIDQTDRVDVPNGSNGDSCGYKGADR